MGKIYGYVRVSSTDQNEDRQMIALKEKGLQGKWIYMDKQSGKDFNRPNYQKMQKKLQSGDLLYILSIDRKRADITVFSETVKLSGAYTVFLD